MRIALDATYSIDPNPSGIAIYSQEILNGLTQIYPDNRYLFCYRWKQWRRARGPLPLNARRRLLHPPLPLSPVDLFHALNQRMDHRIGRRVVTTFHDLFVITGEYSSREFRERFTAQARRAAQNSDAIIAVSVFTAEQVTTLLGIDRSRVRVVPHGVYRPNLPLPVQRQPVILFVGALQHRKNVIRLVEAFERLPGPWKLVLAGATSGYRAHEILARIEASPQQERIEVKGYLSPDELKNLYAAASIFAFPSLDEGFGIPILEAMAHGVPVVTSKTSAMPEVAGDAALLVDPHSVEEIAGALQRLAGSNDLREKLSRAGYARAGLFSWERAVRQTYAVYQELL